MTESITESAAATQSALTQSGPAAEAPRATENRSTTPRSESFAEYISGGWAPRATGLPAQRAVAIHAADRRSRLSALHEGRRLIIPAGPAKVRSNDTDYLYRAHSAFLHLTGWGSDAVPGSVLVLEPRPATDQGGGHDATVYLRESAGRDTDEFYANPEIGEFWTGARPSLDDVAAELGVLTGSLRGFLTDDLAERFASVPTLLIADADPALTARLASRDPDDIALDTELARDASELRLVKDAWEVDEMRAAVAATHRGFTDIVADLAEAAAHPRGERVVEGTFNRRARIDGNAVGYETIAASGPHACILHWTRNDGAVLLGDLILIDAGVEVDSCYTADITRTLPIAGTFTDVQRRVYDAVLEAADAAFAIVRPGIRFREIHAEAMRVIAQRTAEWGLLPVSAEESLQPDAQFHRRYMVHGTSHHLGMDVHDCAQARRDLYLDGVLEAGMVFTIEPGLYFQPDDLTVPEEYRGIGVRIEDDILVTATGAENLSAAIPRTADAVEAWLAGR